MPTTSFDVANDGFCFSNADIDWSIGPFSGKQLCGGMAYAALDYYNTDLVVPADTTAPAPKTTLHNYIFERQNIAHNNTVPRFVGSWAPIIGPLIAEAPQGLETKSLAGHMGRDHPIPICLVGHGNGHHVVAIGFTPDPFDVEIYDPNIPGKSVHLVRKDGKYVNNGSGSAYRGFFVDDGYKVEDPPILGGEDKWRHCFRCRTLFFGVSGTSPCPVGGSHFPHGSANYVLNLRRGRGEPGWRYCNKCQELHYALEAGMPGTCPADGGFHLPNPTWEYRVAVDTGPNVLGQSNWYRCTICQGLFFRGGGQGGVCPAGGEHTPDLSTKYKLPFK